MDNLLQILPRRNQPLWVRYSATLAIVIVFFLIRAGLEGRVGYGFFVLMPGIFLPAILFDRGSGFIATAISSALLYALVGGTLEPTIIDDHIIPFGLFIAISLGMVTLSEALRKALERAVAAEQSKDLLLREMGHRIKNNLQTVASLLQMQSRSEQSEETRINLESAVTRVYVIADAHDFLRPDTHDGEIDMREYLTDLGDRLARMLRGSRPVAVRIEAEAVPMRAERAVLIGLIVNELVTNSFKYAFTDAQSGAIDVRFQRAADGRFELIVEDDGRGLADGHKEGFGTRLVRLMVQQLDGSIDWQKVQPGQRVVVKVPEK